MCVTNIHKDSGWSSVERPPTLLAASRIPIDSLLVVTVDSPDVAAAKKLMDVAHDRGFHFDRIAEGPDAPLLGRRETVDWRDEIYLAGFSNSCSALRRKRYSLIVPGGLPVTASVEGDAITVLHTVVCDWPL